MQPGGVALPELTDDLGGLLTLPQPRQFLPSMHTALARKTHSLTQLVPSLRAVTQTTKAVSLERGQLKHRLYKPRLQPSPCLGDLRENTSAYFTWKDSMDMQLPLRNGYTLAEEPLGT